MDYREVIRRSATPLIEDGKAVLFWFGEFLPRLIGDCKGWNADEPVYHTRDTV